MPRPSGEKLIVDNRRARHEYHLGDRYEAGLVLTGTEVKSLRTGKVTLHQAYADVRDGEAWLIGLHVPEYLEGNRANHEPDRPRKLLLHRREIDRLLGSVRERGLKADDPRVDALAAEGKTVVYVVLDERPVGAIALADVIRKESFDAVARLKAMGIRCMMLTGDAKAVAESVARELGLDDFFAEVLPDQKAAKVRDVKGRGLTVAMIGDGVNDAPALVESDLGIAVGAGTDVAIEAADMVLVRSDPRDVFAILALSRATYGKMVQNLLWATGYNTFAIPLAAGIGYPWGFLLSPAAGAALMSLSTVIVAINAKLLERARRLVASASATG